MADPLQFSDLFSTNGLGFLVGDTASSSETDRKRYVNDAYIELASIRGFWRKRSTTITLTAGTSAYNLSSDFSDIYRLYYRTAGRYYEVEVVGDAQWLEVSATNTADSGEPRFARITQTSSTQNQIELTPPPSSSFVESNSTLTMEYFIEITRLVNDSDEPILPANLRHHIMTYAGYLYALAQGDFGLADQLRVRAEEAKATVLNHDLRRTGKGRRLYPARGYWPDDERMATDYN